MYRLHGNNISCRNDAPWLWVTIEGATMTVSTGITSSGRRLFTAPVQADGSVAAEVEMEWPRKGERTRVKVPSGSGVRPVEFLTLLDACIFKIDP